jgi:hypothetical protein
MSTQEILLIVAYFVAAWLLGGVAIATPMVIRAARARRAERPPSQHILRR